MIVADSDVLIDSLRGRQEARARIGPWSLERRLGPGGRSRSSGFPEIQSTAAGGTTATKFSAGSPNITCAMMGSVDSTTR
jgi:hypothetical protein